MSDYTYHIVIEEPPAPRVSPWLRARSWARPIRGWTTGVGLGWEGKHAMRRQWEITRGRVRSVGIDHSCGETKTCPCATDRQW